MASDIALIYVSSFFAMYVMFTFIPAVMFRSIFVEFWRKKFMVSRGFGYIRINGNDRVVNEYFKNCKKEHIEIDGHAYFIDSKKAKFRGKAVVYEFKQGISEPIDVYSEKLIGTDSEYLSGFLMKMKALARVTAASEMKMILYAAGAAAVVAAICAVLSYTNYNTLEVIRNSMGI